MLLKDLSIKELSSGYTEDKHTGTCTCVFCGKTFEEGIMYFSNDKYVNAKRAIEEHIIEEHEGVFYSLLNLDKDINGLSTSQKNILEGMYLEKDNKVIGEELGISGSTVRTHKFNIQKMKKEAKILLAILEQIEDKETIARRKKLEESIKRNNK